ncbi:hypothetical protein G647_00313 [Cladophialophora carrionii CBS 160.54]|uniref:Uncharacterized protein n=1 Tax=Cladophialophora carrionii CBS 160.54 TaxID=1279043 RepID=V9DLU9_9EURO|nr:uncharacterized protein G647_00313 [Cladophialophora carrionii CBS 160.54]ETI27864.1 hypothetical protein G647_00313 [Cladophialophora carrionii CBS 160.54]
MPSPPERWVVWNTSPHHYCHDKSLFFNLNLTTPMDSASSQPDDLSHLTKEDFIVLGQGDVVIPIPNKPESKVKSKFNSLRLRDVFYYKTDKPRNIINLTLLWDDYPKLMLGKMKLDDLHGTGIVHVDDPETVILEVDEFDELR